MRLFQVGEMAVPCVVLETVFSALTYATPEVTISELNDDSKVMLFGLNAFYVLFAVLLGAFTLLLGIIVGISCKFVEMCGCDQKRVVYEKVEISCSELSE